jgi:hypothetical protein
MKVWTKGLPTKEGKYWFYGYRDGKMLGSHKNEPEMLLMKVIKTSSGGLLSVAEGAFVFAGEVENAWHTEANLPDPPINFGE